MLAETILVLVVLSELGQKNSSSGLFEVPAKGPAVGAATLIVVPLSLLEVAPLVGGPEHPGTSPGKLILEASRPEDKR